MHKRIQSCLVHRITIHICNCIRVGYGTPSWICGVNRYNVSCTVFCNSVLLSCQFRRRHAYRSFARICNCNFERISQGHNVSGVEGVVDPVLYRVNFLLDDQIRVSTCQVECSSRCPVVRENHRIKGGHASIIVEKFNCECSAIYGGCLGNQVVDVPNLVNLSSSQNVGLVCKWIWLVDCQSSRGTGIDEGHNEILCH